MYSTYVRVAAQTHGLKLYWQTLSLLRKSQRWSQDRLANYQIAQLRNMLHHCGTNVPYYRKLFREIAFDPAQLRHTSDLAAIPMLDKEIVRSQSKELLAENIPRSKWNYYTTGGTMGNPVGLYGLRAAGWRERAFIETTWNRVGFPPYTAARSAERSRG